MFFFVGYLFVGIEAIKEKKNGTLGNTVKAING